MTQLTLHLYDGDKLRLEPNRLSQMAADCWPFTLETVWYATHFTTDRYTLDMEYAQTEYNRVKAAREFMQVLIETQQTFVTQSMVNAWSDERVVLWLQQRDYVWNGETWCANE